MKNIIGSIYKKACRNVQIILAMIFLVTGFFLCCSLSRAGTIWEIGLKNNSYGEFGLPSLDQVIVTFQASENGESTGNWKFPQYLCPSGLALLPEEIRITCLYLQDYRCPILRIRARSDTDRTQRLRVLKGEEEILLQNNEDLVPFSYSFIEFPLGHIKVGFCVGNDIILKNQALENTKAIFFDYLELVDQDEDRDWSLNSEECEGDTDGDGKEDREDPDTASILIQDCDQTIRKRITLDIQEKEGLVPFLQKLTLLDQNAQEYPSALSKDIFFPYGLFMAKIKIQGEEEKIPLRVIFPEKLYSLAQFYISYSDEDWKELPIEILDGNSIRITLEIKRENNEAQAIQRRKNTNDHAFISISGGLGYPLEMNNELEENGCFISSVYFSILTFRPVALLFYLLLIFILILYLKGTLLTKGNFRQAKDNLFNIFGISRVKKYPIIPIILFCLVLKPALVCAIIFPDMQMNATPNPVGSGARALGVGGAFMAIADDATAASWNPAALLNLKRPEASIVGSYFSGKKKYNTSSIEVEIEDFSQDLKHLNYLSLVCPFIFLQRNVAFSLNYQHLYEFFQDISYEWRYLVREPDLGAIIDIPMRSHKKQKGSLNALSPALAVQVIQSLRLGLTANFWLEDELNNYWENLNIIQGVGIERGRRIKTWAKLYERYKFSGFNTHIGVLWRPCWKVTLGGVLKAPFKANIKHEYRVVTIEEYPQEIALNGYYPHSDFEDLTLRMPISYGIGGSIRFSDKYLMALDIYHTQWKDYILSYPSGEKISPINNSPQDKANIKATTQIRLGAEYVVICPKPVIPLRCGLFYDPEPSSGSVDDFYGISIGTGIKFKDFSFDIAYQYRFGKKKNIEAVLGQEISSEVKQHYLYSSMIFYF